MFWRSTARGLLGMGALLLGLQAARAAESAAVASERATATLVTDTDAVAAGSPFRAGLRLRMAPGWHSYWHNPGDAGAAPELTFDLPPGAPADGIEWPAPERLQEGPVVTYSYTTEVVLPVTVTPARDAHGLHLVAHANWLVCERICVPEEGAFTLDLPAGTPAPSAEARLFAAAAERIPRPSPFAAHVAPDGSLAIAGGELAGATAAWFFPDDWGAVDQSAPQPAEIGLDGIVLRLKPGQQFKADATLAGVLGVRDGAGHDSFWQIAATPGIVAPAAGELGIGVPRALGLALLGGLILNLMPCVFPILAMKALALARLPGAARTEARATAWSYLAGVVLSCMALGGVLLAARAAGGAVGWGFQLQSPVVVAALALLLFAIGLNLSGVYDLRLGVEGAGQGLAARGGHLGSFATGALAVAVATPCTAPFMGAALAAALAAPAAAALAIFAALGLGLALPYVLVAEVPAFARALPRPGAWMEVLRQVLAFPIYGAAAWLVWVVSLQAGSPGVLAALSGLILVGFAAWAAGLSRGFAGAGRWLVRGAAALALVGIIVVLAGLGGAAPPGSATAQAATAEGAEPYSADRLAALRAEGRPVFVNLTAAWCVTCLVNERVALSPAAVRDAFAAHRIAYLKGDWTRQDPAITALLRAHGRDGVPLYLYYAPGAREPRVLPQLLTAGTVLDAVGAAGGTS